MSKIGLVVNINKFNHYFETSSTTFICNDLEEAKNKLIDHLVVNMGNLNIDYPMDFTDFEYIWFKQNYVNTEAFIYYIYAEETWFRPWDSQDIYSDFLDKMIEKDSSNPPDFETIYGEPNPDEETEDKFSMEQNEEIQELEKKLSEIITNAKTSNNHEDQVKECNCERCKEGEELQAMKLKEDLITLVKEDVLTVNNSVLETIPEESS